MFVFKIKELNQRIIELEKTCDQLEDVIDYWKAENKRKNMEIAELEYRLKLEEKEKTELNNVISNLMEERNKSTVEKIAKTKNIKKAKKVEVISSVETK